MDITALNEAAMNSMVSEQTSTNTWEQMVVFVTSNKASYDDTKSAVRTVEQTYKAEHGKALGPAWRSAKSTILKALKMGVPLLGPHDKPLGKTEVSKACREITLIDSRFLSDVSMESAVRLSHSLEERVKQCLHLGISKATIKAAIHPQIQCLMESLDD